MREDKRASRYRALTGARDTFWRLFDRLAPAPLYYPVQFRRSYRWDGYIFDVLRLLASPEKSVIDIGAHRGLLTWFCARHAAHVTAFEAHPGNFRFLQRLQGTRIVCHHTALSDRPGKVTLQVARGTDGRELSESGSISPAPGDGANAGTLRGYEVKACPLDAFQFADVGLIKIDVEGAEAAVIRGAADTIARHRPNLLVEIQEDMIGEDALRGLVSKIQDFGYDGLFFHDRRLQTWDRFDLDRHQRVPRAKGDMKAYANNFIFLPYDRRS